MDLLERYFDEAFEAPNGVGKLRELILTLAMQGKLVSQDPNDEPATVLLKAINDEKEALGGEGISKSSRDVYPIETKDMPYSLPSGWIWVRMGQVCSYIQRGKGPKYLDGSAYRVVSQKCVRWYGLDLGPARCIDPESLDSYDPVRFLLNGDLLWNSTGTGTIGRACLVPSNLEGNRLVADSHVTVMRPLMICKDFLWRWIQSPTVQDEIENSASGTTNQIELNTSTIVDHIMPLAPLAEQRRIVSKIDELMVRCDELEKLRAERDARRLAINATAVRKLVHVVDADGHRLAREFLSEHFGELYTVKENVTELRRAILQLAVMGKLVPQDPNDLPASDLLKQIETAKGRLVDEGKIRPLKTLPPVPHGETPYPIPLGWQWVRLGDVGAFERGRSKHRPRNDKRLFENGAYPFVQTGDVSRSKQTGNQVLTCGSYYNEFGLKQSRLWEKGTLCITIAANIAETGFLGMDACIPDSVVAFVTVERILERLVKLFIDVAKDDLEHFAPSTAQKNINLGIINQLLFPLPPLAEQHRIVSQVDRLMGLCDALDQCIATSAEIQDKLLSTVMAKFEAQQCA